MSDQFIFTSPADPRGAPLVQALSHEYERRYGDFYQQSGEPREMEKYPAELFTPAHRGIFVLLLRNGVAVAGGAFKQLDDQTAEFKRIWTQSELRRQGLARRILVVLEQQAVQQGYRRVYLTTGFRQPEAVGLYVSHGYSQLYDPQADLEALRRLPFEKRLPAALEAAA